MHTHDAAGHIPLGQFRLHHLSSPDPVTTPFHFQLVQAEAEAGAGAEAIGSASAPGAGAGAEESVVGDGGVPTGEGDAAGFAGMPVLVPVGTVIPVFCHPSCGQLPVPTSTPPHVLPVLIVLQGKHPPGTAPKKEPWTTSSPFHVHRRSGSEEHVAGYYDGSRRNRVRETEAEESTRDGGRVSRERETTCVCVYVWKMERGR